jgi:hypothetical protein
MFRRIRIMTATRLEALMAGAEADGISFSGTVHSVFTRACNIEVQRGRLLSLVARDAGAVPRGFTLATPDGFDFAAHIEIARPAASRNGVLRIDGAPLAIDLRTARPWRSNLSSIGIDLDDKDTALAWRAAWQALSRHGGSAAFAAIAAAPIRILVGATQSGQIGDARIAVSQLIGLGEGLTPAGDDFLVGYLAGLWSASRAKSHDAVRDTIGGAIAANAARTGTISRHYLEAAIAGEVSEPLARLSAAIGSGDTRQTERAAAAALSVGATSGAAASHGLLLAAGALSSVTPPAV